MSEVASETGIMMLAITIFLVPIIGTIMAITPYLMKKSECFAVTVPESALYDPYLKGLKRRYASIVAAITLVMTIIGVVFAVSSNELGALIVIVAGTSALCFIGYALMLYFRQKVRLYKKARNWVADQQESVAFVPEGEIPQAISLKWNLLHIPIMLITLAIGYIGYASMPDQVPLQVGFDGQISTYAEKSPMLIWFPVLIQAFLAVCISFSHWSITRSKRSSSPHAPATSALAYGMFAHAQSIFILATGLIIATLMIAVPLSFMGIVTLMQAGTTVLIGTIIIVIGAVAISVVYGQGGSRIFMHMNGSDTFLADDDRHWKLGIFYFNPQDPSLFLLERFGVGWTVNWARPLVWVILAAGLVITIGFIIAVLTIA